MNKNEYRRALIMLRSLKSGLSGYVRLERRTMMGTLQFTVNGVVPGQTLHAALLRPQNGTWSGVKAGDFGPARYGQSGLLWKFDPRSIDGKALEQYSLAAIVSTENGICELLLCGNLNGSTDADWSQVREAACRLYSPVRISGTPIPPISEAPDETEPVPLPDKPQILPDTGEETPAYPGVDEGTAAPSGSPDHNRPAQTQPEAASSQCRCSDRISDSGEDIAPAVSDEIAPESSDVLHRSEALTASPEVSVVPVHSESAPPLPDTTFKESPITEVRDIQTSEAAIPAAAITPQRISLDALDMPAIEPDELDTPALQDSDVFLTAARSAAASSRLQSENAEHSIAPAPSHTAGDLLNLSSPDTPWPESIEPLRSLFFSSEAIIPFEEAGYVFIRAPLPEESGYSSCVVGILAENGFPASVLYALPAPYSPEPPAGLEGYAWRGNHARGYWFTVEQLHTAT